MPDMRVFAERVVDMIIADLSDRGGLGNEWDAIDSDTQKEIKVTWRSMVERQMKKLVAKD